jgi:hypothetical protein
MGGAEIGMMSAAESQTIGDLLLVNRELALEAAQERSERVLLGFRKNKVFEKTFQTNLKDLNNLIGFTEVGEGGFVPVGYHDPHAELTIPSSIDQV